jgi:hypothetical protein
MNKNPNPEDLTNRDDVVFDSSDTVLVVIDGPWDMTVRPFPGHLPRWYPGREPPPELKMPSEQPSSPTTPQV